MPPRFVYWTIIAGGLPTAFRAAEREDLLPTFQRIKQKHPDAEMKWFARGTLWASKEEADREREEWKARMSDRERGGAGSRKPSGFGADGPRRGRDWRPGGEHKDPRQKYKDAKKARNLDRRQERFTRKHGDDKPRVDTPASDTPRAERPLPTGPRSERPGTDRPRFDKPRFDKPGFAKPRFEGTPRFDKPRTDKPRFEKSVPDGPRGTRPDGDRPPRRFDRPEKKWDRPAPKFSRPPAKPFGPRPGGPKPTGPGRGPKPAAPGRGPRPTGPGGPKPTGPSGGSRPAPSGHRPSGPRPGGARSSGPRPDAPAGWKKPRFDDRDRKGPPRDKRRK